MNSELQGLRSLKISSCEMQNALFAESSYHMMQYIRSYLQPNALI